LTVPEENDSLESGTTEVPMAEPAVPLAFSQRSQKSSWPAQGEWTYADYLRLPDDGRVYEVIRGHLYMPPGPGYEHQLAVSSLCWLLTSFVRPQRLGVVLVAPFDIRLPHQIADPVQPDVLFFKKGNEPRPGDKSFSGVPDLVVEVLSPGTRRLDEQVKLAAYRDAGVPEVWLADPLARTLLVLDLNEKTHSYDELALGRLGETVGSRVMQELRVKIDEVFPIPSGIS